MKNIYLFIIAFFNFSILFSQTQPVKTIKLGVRYEVDNDSIYKDPTKSNLYYLFEYDFLKMFESFLENNKQEYKIEYKKIKQKDKLKYLNSNHDNKVDAIIYAVSITESRSKDYLFSRPYFSNKSIVLASNDPSNRSINLNKDVVKIGFVTGTTSGDEIILLAKKRTNIIEVPKDSFEELLATLKKGEIDAITGDRSLLSTYFLENELYFKGNLPTKNSQIGDFYGVIANTHNYEIIKIFNQYIKTNETQIKGLSDKYFSIIDNKLMNYNEKNTFSYKTVALGVVAFLLLFGLMIWYFLKRLQKMQVRLQNIRNDNILKIAGENMEKMAIKFQDKLEAEDVANVGIEFFNTAKEKITYIGSGGFLSDVKYGEKWKASIHKALERGIIFDRIIDLPKIDFNKLSFENMDYFHPETYDRFYVKKYLKWLLLQYIDLANFGENFQIHNSRGASLWGYGLVIMIKDTSEVLFFTTNQDKKIGSVIVNPELASHFAALMEIVKNVGKEINEHDIEREFFSTENNLKSLITDFKNEVQENSYIELTDELSDKIDSLSKSINRRFNDLNNTK